MSKTSTLINEKVKVEINIVGETINWITDDIGTRGQTIMFSMRSSGLKMLVKRS